MQATETYKERESKIKSKGIYWKEVGVHRIIGKAGEPNNKVLESKRQKPWQSLWSAWGNEWVSPWRSAVDVTQLPSFSPRASPLRNPMGQRGWLHGHATMLRRVLA